MRAALALFAGLLVALMAAQGCLVTLPEVHDECATGTTACAGRCVRVAEDAHNCGVCGHDCGAQTCSRGSCEIATVPSPFALATHPSDEFIYGTQGQASADGTHLFKFPKDCGSAKPCTVTRMPPDRLGDQTAWLRQRALVVDETAVYWINIGRQIESDPINADPPTGTVWRMPKSDPTKVCASPDRQGRPFGIALAPDGYLYWSNLIGGAGTGGQLMRVKKDALCTDKPQAVDAATSHNVGPIAIVPKPITPPSTSSYYLLWGTRDTRGTERGVFRIEPNSPAPPSTVRENAILTAAAPSDVVTDLKIFGDAIFFRYGRLDAEAGQASVRRAQLDVQRVSSVLYEASDPRQVAVDATHLYWTDGGKPARIVRAPIAGGAVETVAITDSAQALLLDGPYLYFGEYRNGVVRRVRVKL